MENSIERKISTNEIRRQLEAKGYRFIVQDGHKDGKSTFVEIYGQQVEVPFTNMPNMQIALKKESGQWMFVGRDTDLEKLVAEIAMQER